MCVWCFRVSPHHIKSISRNTVSPTISPLTSSTGAAANTEQAQYIKTNEFAYDPEAELGSCSTSARATFITWPAPTCEQFPSTSRENHNGADAEGHMPTMNVVFPTFDEAQRCVMRLRWVFCVQRFLPRSPTLGTPGVFSSETEHN